MFYPVDSDAFSNHSFCPVHFLLILLNLVFFEIILYFVNNPIQFNNVADSEASASKEKKGGNAVKVSLHLICLLHEFR